MTFIMFLSAPRIISSITITTLLNFYHYHFWFEFISPVSFYGFMKSEEFYVMFIDIKFQSSLLCLTSCWCLFLNCQSRITEFGWVKFHVLLCQSYLCYEDLRNACRLMHNLILMKLIYSRIYIFSLNNAKGDIHAACSFIFHEIFNYGIGCACTYSSTHSASKNCYQC